MEDLDDLLPHMRHVLHAERELHEQKLMWSMIEASSAIGCPEHADSLMPTLSATREHFGVLEQRLVDALARENLDALGDSLGALAQSAIDILVRNLFERTADVGFLATDAPLVRFCALPDAEQAAAATALSQRLQAYRDTYTVYDDIAVIGRDGTVRLRLDAAAAGEAVSVAPEPWFEAALSRHGFVEHHGPSVLGLAGEPALLYAHRIDDERGSALGVLALRFRIADEAAQLFAAQVGAREDVAVMLLDDERRVLFSNDPAHIPPGSVMRPAEPGAVRLTTFGGREYLAVNCPARPYQAYPGPGWHAQAMVSLLTAFRPVPDDPARRDDAVTLGAGTLEKIRGEVDEINRNLRRVVWNGRLMAGGHGGEQIVAQASLKAVLHQVTLAGSRMRQRVGDAIGDLRRTSIARVSQRAGEMARLATDIMDRNLYERANDCRWWALSPVLREGLAAGGDGVHATRMGQTLSGIHALYTVYTRLVVFGTDGRIRASSLDGDGALIGQPVDPRWVERTLALRDPRHYRVSGFEAGALSDGKPSYVYLAAVHAPGSDQVVGGVAIAFNAEREFAAMLADVMGTQAGIAAYVDAGGQVVASNAEAFPPGSRWTLATEPGVFVHDGAHHAGGVAPGRGYREFKRSDGYDNGVRAVVALRLGAVERRRHALFDEILRSHPASSRARHEMAVFQVGPARYALPVEAVREACPPAGLVRTPVRGAYSVGLLSAPGSASQMLPVWCARRLLQIDNPSREGDGVVLMLADPARPGHVLGGLMVDDVNSVLEVDPQQVQPLPEAMRHSARWLAAVVRVPAGSAGQSQAMLQVVDLPALAEVLAPGRASVARDSLAA